MSYISFEGIPLDILTPGTFIEFDNSHAVRGAAIMPHRILVFGQIIASGTGDADSIVTIFNERQAEQVAGSGSMLHRMIRALKRVNPTTELHAILLADAAASVAATGKITVASGASASGAINLYIGGDVVRVGVQSGATPAQIATSIIAAINAATILPVTAAVDAEDAAEVVLTAKNKGLVGNTIPLVLNYYDGEALPAGVSLTLAPMAGGVTNPDITDAFALLGDAWHTTYVTPYTDAANMTALEGELKLRAGPLRMVDGIAYAATAGSLGELSAYGAGRNSQFVSTLGVVGPVDVPCEWAAAYAGAATFAAQVDPAQPVSDIVLTGLKPPAGPARPRREERDILLHNGIATWTVNAAGEVVLERAITGYRLDGAGLADRSYLDTETLRTLSYLRFSMRARLAARYRRKKLGKDGSTGPNVVTPRMIRAELIALFGDWMELGLVQDIEQFKRDVTVEISSADPNRVNILVPAHLINQLRVMAGKVQFIL